MEEIRFVIITGLSGAGKSEVVKCFEDLDYFCVDNLPPALIPKFAELCSQSEGRVSKIALVVDIRGGGFFNDIFSALEELEQSGFKFEILFLEAREEILIRRFKESRRPHPLAENGTISDGIRAEIIKLSEIRGRAGFILDTSDIQPRGLREIIREKYEHSFKEKGMSINIVSFGFKSGILLDADLVLDVRFLPNPYYVENLRNLTGNDSAVSEYVLKWPITTKFISKLYNFIGFLVPQYIQEGKSNLVIGIGCTGGRHRSVTIANKLTEFLNANGYSAVVRHRDIEENRQLTLEI